MSTFEKCILPWKKSGAFVLLKKSGKNLRMPENLV